MHVGRSQVGIVTSGCLSTTLNKNIALCRIDSQYSEPGTEVEVGKIDGHQNRRCQKIDGHQSRRCRGNYRKVKAQILKCMVT